MVDPVTTNVRLAQPLHASHVDDWDQPINANAGIIDTCFGSVTTKSLSNVLVTLSDTESQASILRFTGTLTANVAVTLGAIIKTWTIENLTTGNFFIRLQGSTGAGNFVGLPPGSCQVYWDGANLNYVNLDKIGAYWDYCGSAMPLWVQVCTVPPYLYCDGSSFSAVTYPQLAQILGTTVLPDARARSRIALDGGANRITVGGCGIDGNAVRSAGGSQNQTLVQANLPNCTFPNTLGITDTQAWSVVNGTNVITQTPGVSFGGGPVGGSVNLSISRTGGISINGGVTSGGGGSPLTTVQPTYVGGITLIRAA